MEPTTPTTPSQSPAPVSSMPPAPAEVPRKKRSGRLLMWVIVVILLVGAIIAGAFWMMDRDDDAQAQSAQVTIGRTGFTPPTIKIKKGQTVEWISRDSAPHQVIADGTGENGDTIEFDSQEQLGLNESFSVVFEDAGTFNYHDKLNPLTLKGIVIVEE